MICDLCREESDQVVHVNSWTVCQWCVTNNVLDRALEVESVVAQLNENVAKASASHQRDVMEETVAESEVESAYAALTSAMLDLASSNEHSRESLQKARAAQEALEEYRDRESRRVRELREHA
jgi:hypothetical protein